MFVLRLQEHPVPVGSDEPDILLAWILDTMGLVRRRNISDEVVATRGSIHALMKDCLLPEPLRGWDSQSMIEASGISSTALHHQLVKLRSCGLLATVTEGRWKRHIIRNGSLSAAIELIAAQAEIILKQRMSILDDVIVDSETRMEIDSLQRGGEDLPFRIIISEQGPIDQQATIESLLRDFGFTGDRGKTDDDLSMRVFTLLGSAETPLTADYLMNETNESRTRILGILDRLRSALLVERVLLEDRISHNLFIGFTHQWAQRGEQWIRGRGGLGRIEQHVADQIISDLNQEKLTTERISKHLDGIDIGVKCLLVNTLGGRVPYGYRLTGKDASAVFSRLLSRVERILERLQMISKKYDQIT